MADSTDTISVPLDKPIDTHTGKLSAVTLRKPTMGDYRALGEPISVAQTAAGAQVLVENKEAIAGYMQRCILDQALVPLIDAQASIADARRIREAILSFFRTGGDAAPAA